MKKLAKKDCHESELSLVAHTTMLEISCCGSYDDDDCTLMLMDFTVCNISYILKVRSR